MKQASGLFGESGKMRTAPDADARQIGSAQAFEAALSPSIVVDEVDFVGAQPAPDDIAPERAVAQRPSAGAKGILLPGMSRKLMNLAGAEYPRMLPQTPPPSPSAYGSPASSTGQPPTLSGSDSRSRPARSLTVSMMRRSAASRAGLVAPACSSTSS